MLRMPKRRKCETSGLRPFTGATEETRKDEAKGREFIRAELEKIKRPNLNTVYVEAFWRFD
ncbi:MAG TPA: hypothetical protein VF644_09135 [Pyrinomonadaceae bacterium]